MPSLSQTNLTLIAVERWLTLIIYPTMLILGNIGNIFNLILFSRKKLRTISCSNYLFASSITNLIALNISIIPLIHMELYPTALTINYCRCEMYIMSSTLQMSRFFVLSACFDRYALSSQSANLRNLSNVRFARRIVIPAIVVVWSCVPLHIPIFLTVEHQACILKGSIALYHNVYSMIFIGILPPGLMFLFSILIFRNLKMKQNRRQIQPTTNVAALSIINKNLQVKRRDHQVFVMLLVQAFAYIISSTPYTITIFYLFISLEKDLIEGATSYDPIRLFILFLTDMLRFVCPFISFYLYVLVSRMYRQEMVHAFRNIVTKLFGKCVNFQPVTNTNNTVNRLTTIN